MLGACTSSKQNFDKSSELKEKEIIVVKKLTASSNLTNLEKITGSLNYSGSEPFVIPTIFISGESSFRLIGNDEFIKNIYPTINGEKASLYGKIIEKGQLTYFEIYFYEIIND
ncbi:MAG: hypothetical protein BalsKO_19510 [Balneolaceae bacterium]